MRQIDSGTLKSFKLPDYILRELKRRSQRNGKKMYFYATELIELGIEREDKIKGGSTIV